MSFVGEFFDLIHGFKYDIRDLPAGTVYFPLGGAVIYIIVLNLLKQVSSTEIRSKSFEIVHNLFLVILSFSMFSTAIYGAFIRAQEDGLAGLVCTTRPVERIWDGPLGAVQYVFYLSKFYEFVDTFILSLRKKPTIFLHCWHHAVMPWVCWALMGIPFFEGAWWCTWTNSLIHTFMYSYYLATCFGIKVWFKKYMTQMQIVQFFAGMFFSIAWAVCKYGLDMGCTSDWRTAAMTNGINLTFIALFAKFYFDSYKNKKAKKT